MNDIDFYKIAAIISPFITAIITSTITYYFTLRSKKLEVIYQNRINEYKIIVTKLVAYKMFCEGRIAYYLGNEYSPVWTEEFGTFEYRRDIYNTMELNSFHLSQKSKDSINNLIAEMGTLCNAESWELNGEKNLNMHNAYDAIIKKTENCIKIIYKDIKQ